MGPALGGAQIVDEDAYQAAKYLIAAQAFPENRNLRTLTSLLERAKRSLTPDELENARSEAEALVASWPDVRAREAENKTPRPDLPPDGADCEN